MAVHCSYADRRKLPPVEVMSSIEFEDESVIDLANAEDFTINAEKEKLKEQ